MGASVSHYKYLGGPLSSCPHSNVMADTVKTQLNYFVAPVDGSKPYRTVYTNNPDTNYTHEPHEVEIENVRGKEDSVTLDTAGFQFLKAPSKHTAFSSDADIEAEYYPESIELLKKVTGASRVVLFDHSEINNNSMLLERP